MNDVNKLTTLLLDASFLPYSFLTAKSTFLHLVKNNIKCFDAEGNIIESNYEWFDGNVPLYDDQPFLRSKNKTWFLPTIAVVKTRFYVNKKRLPRTLSLQKLCVLFDYTCQICYEKFPKQDLTIEHIYPRSKGGNTNIENISLSCSNCNQKKRDIYPFYNVKGKKINTIPLPLPVIPKSGVGIREEWEKFFVYKKL